MAPQHLFTVDTRDTGSRLDFYIASRLSCGQRTAKRLIINGYVTVNGRARLPQYKLVPGLEVAVSAAVPEDPAGGISGTTTPVAQNADYAVFNKPKGLHTASIAGSAAASLEKALENHIPPVTLLSRLDRDTSGLVASAFSPEAVERFKKLEAEGSVRKEYVALVRGVLSTHLLLNNALDTDNRKTTRVLDGHSEDSCRFTEVTPLSLTPPLPDATVVVAAIKRGGRHQIRAHLAHAGYPIVGDRLYGGNDFPGPLYLHHARLTLPGLTVFVPPPWLPDFLEDFL